MVRNHVSLGQRRLPLRWLAGVLPENRLAPGRLVVPFYSSARTKGTTTHATTTEQAAADALFTTGHPAEPLLGSPVVRALLPHWRLQRNPDARKKGIDKDRDGEIYLGGRVLTFKPVRYANARGRRNARCPNRASGMLVPPLPEPPGKYISSRGVKHFQRTNPPKNRNKKIALIRGANFSGALFVYVVCARFGTANSSSTVSEALPPRAHLLRLGWGWGPVIATQDGARTGPGAGLRLISGPNFRANLRPAVCSVLEPIWGQNAPNFQPIFGQVRSPNSDPFRVWPWPISGARFGPFPVPDLAHPQSRASPTSDAARSGLPRPEPRIATFFNEAPSFSEICSGNRDTWQDPL